MRSSPGFIVPATADEALSRGIGICGNHIAAFEAILRRLNVPVRSVQLWYTDANDVRQNHILTEVEWDNRWHLFDVTWGATYPGPDSTASHPDPLSIADVLKRKERPVWNPNNPTTRSIFAKGDDPFAYLDGNELSVTIAEVGEVKVKPAELRGNTRVESFRDIPNYVGFNNPEARDSGLSFLFDGLMGRFDVTVNVTAHQGCSTGGLVLDGVVVAAKDGVIQFRGITDPRRLSATSSDDVCYIVMRSVEFEPAAID
jgi:Transglutaminase-like superfamily